MADSASRQVEAAERLRKFKSVTLYGVSAVATLCALVLLLNKVPPPPFGDRADAQLGAARRQLRRAFTVLPSQRQR